MPDPAPHLPNDQTRWFLDGFSLTSLESAMVHLSRGWLQFTPAVAVLLCRRSFADSTGCFLRQGDPPRFLPACSTDEDSSHPGFEDFGKELATDLAFKPIVTLEWNGQRIGWVRLWTNAENEQAECDWFLEASARFLWTWQQIEAQLQRDKLDALAEFAAGAGHEINNPIATISGRVQGLLQSETDAERRRQLLTIGGQALRIRDMIGDTMLFARPPVPNPELLDLQKVIPDIIKPLSGELKTASFSCTIPQPVPIFADRVQLAVVITELLRNSLEWQDNGGMITLSASTVDSPQGPMAQIVIEDDGESFTERDQPHLFDPFYCGRQAGRGLGFGLPKCWRIVSNHQGQIAIASLPERGTRVTIHWPSSARSIAST